MACTRLNKLELYKNYRSNKEGKKSNMGGMRSSQWESWNRVVKYGQGPKPVDRITRRQKEKSRSHIITIERVGNKKTERDHEKNDAN